MKLIKIQLNNLHFNPVHFNFVSSFIISSINTAVLLIFHETKKSSGFNYYYFKCLKYFLKKRNIDVKVLPSDFSTL